MAKVEQTDLFKNGDQPFNTERENRQFYFDRLQFEKGNKTRNRARANAQRAKKRKEKNGKFDV